MQRIRIALLATLLLGLWLVSVPGPGDSRAAQKAGQTPFDAQAVLARTANLPVGAGTGGGDMAEVEPNDTMPTANAVHDLPFNCTGTIARNGDEDVLAVPMVEGMPIEVNVFSKLDGGIQSPLDPRVVARTAATVIAENDDAAPGDRNAQVNFVAPSTETLYIVVASHGGLGGPSFNYVVMVLPVTGNAFDPANYESESGEADEIVPPGVRIGTLTWPIKFNPPDQDWFYFDAPAGATAVIDVSARVLGYPIGWFPLVVEYSGPDGTGWVESENVNGADPLFNMKIVETGRYYFVVRYRISGHLPEWHGDTHYMVSVTLQDGSESPSITKLKVTPKRPYKLKKIVGSGFDPTGMVIDILGIFGQGTPSDESPTTVILVKPHWGIHRGIAVTVMRSNGRRSNILVFE